MYKAKLIAAIARKKAGKLGAKPAGMKGLSGLLGLFGLGTCDPTTGLDSDTNDVVDINNNLCPPPTDNTAINGLTYGGNSLIPTVPPQCARNPTSSKCLLYFMVQSTVQANQQLIAALLQLENDIAQLMTQFQNTVPPTGTYDPNAYPPAGGQVDPNTGLPYNPYGGGAYPNTGVPYSPAPLPPQMPNPGGGPTDQIPAGFDSGGDPFGGGDAFVPQDISISSNPGNMYQAQPSMYQPASVSAPYQEQQYAPPQQYAPQQQQYMQQQPQYQDQQQQVYREPGSLLIRPFIDQENQIITSEDGNQLVMSPQMDTADKFNTGSDSIGGEEDGFSQ